LSNVAAHANAPTERRSGHSHDRPGEFGQRSKCEGTPEEWLWENSEFDIPARFDRAAALQVLERCATPDFWRTV